ncbi:MAG: DUF4013 domain-containing protein [Ardenticatenaceae bacterium]|nr:DUF4013 domain-containing protein [Anaerolineales bacterium]MCB8922393.1 DUF4013 domain-containing protein [Ardenticatenaceae bacterium]MCB8991325.1 DUF4013 domain-containing protein [Ardenticatenaceae bacterium]
MDIAKAFTFVTEDKNWMTKIGIGVGIVLLSMLLLGIPMLLLVGYQLAITRNVMNGEKEPLPEWDNFGQYFMDGLYITLARLIYTSPFLILVCIGVLVTVVPAMGAGSGSDELAGLLAGTAVVVWLLLACVGLLFGLALFFIAPAISLQYVRTNDFSACLRFGEVIGIARDNIGDITIVALVLIVANFVLQAVIGSLAATGCGLIIAIPLAWVVFPWLAMSGGHMYGQIAAKIEGKGMAF